MATKTLSSRDPSLDDLEQLQEFAFILFDVMEEDEEISDDRAEVMEQIQTGILALAEEYEELKLQNNAMLHDLIGLSANNISLMMELRRCAMLLAALANPPSEKILLDMALQVLRKEGNASLSTIEDEESDSGILLDVNITFNEDDLREGLAAAINEYNNSLANLIITGTP
jgi:hypothetical protein